MVLEVENFQVQQYKEGGENPWLPVTAHNRLYAKVINKGTEDIRKRVTRPSAGVIQGNPVTPVHNWPSAGLQLSDEVNEVLG